MDKLPAWRPIIESTVQLYEIEYRELRLAIWKRKSSSNWCASCVPIFRDIDLLTSDLDIAKKAAVYTLREEAHKLALKVHMVSRAAEP